MSRGSVYQAAHSGDIDVIRIGHRIKAVTAPLRKKLGSRFSLPTEEVKTVDTVTNPKTVKPKRWRDVLHDPSGSPSKLPELSETELRELADDIEAHGLR